jgi:hypothetical protein
VGVAISGLTAATDFPEAAEFEIEDAGVSKRLSKAQLRQLLFDDPAFSFESPQQGDVLVYDGSDWVPGGWDGWRVIHQDAYGESSPASSSTITFAGGAPSGGVALRATDYFAVGDPVRVVIGGLTYYGICDAVSATLLTIAGSILPLSAITSLSVGTPDKVRHVEMRYLFEADDYTNKGVSTPVEYGLTHRWRGKTGYLASFSVSHMNTSSTTVVNLQLGGGSNVSTAGVTPAAGTTTTHGAFVENALGDLIQANVEIQDKQTIRLVVPTTGGTGTNPVVCMVFVVP